MKFYKPNFLFSTIVVATALVCFTSCQEDIDERAAREAKEFTTKNCPTPIIDNSRIDSITYDIASRTIHYYRTLFGLADNAEEIRQNELLLHQELVKEFQSSTSIKIFIEAGIDFKLTYHSGSDPNRVIYETTITANELK